jgi:hypothetical protein
VITEVVWRLGSTKLTSALLRSLWTVNTYQQDKSAMISGRGGTKYFVGGGGKYFVGGIVQASFESFGKGSRYSQRLCMKLNFMTTHLPQTCKE